MVRFDKEGPLGKSQPRRTTPPQLWLPLTGSLSAGLTLGSGGGNPRSFPGVRLNAVKPGCAAVIVDSSGAPTTLKPGARLTSLQEA